MLVKNREKKEGEIMITFYELLPLLGVSALGLMALFICVFDACFHKNETVKK